MEPSEMEIAPPLPIADARSDRPNDLSLINILIVDDEPKNLTVLETVLDDPAYRIIRATSAEEALLALVAHEFALLILDIRMPGMNGFELAQMIKDRKKTADIPIIFLTAYYNEDQHILEGYSTGAVDYLHKPINAAILRSKVSVFAELHRKNRECGLANRSLASEIAERRRIEEKLRELNGTLERRVDERTEELRDQQSNLLQAAQAARLTYVEIDFRRHSAKPARNFSEVMGFAWVADPVMDLADATRRMLDNVVPDDARRLMVAFQRFVNGQNAGRVHYRVMGDDSKERWIESQWSMTRGLDGSPLRIFATNLDISLAKRAEHALRRSEERLRLALDSAELGSWRIEPTLGLLTSDERFRQILGTTEDPVHYEHMFRMIHRDDLDRVRDSLHAAMRHANSESFEVEFRVMFPDGRVRWAYAKGRANFSERVSQDELLSIDGTLADITERKRIEENLRRANSDLEQFAFSASHDLQEPLRNVVVYCQLIHQRFSQKLDAEGEVFLDFIVEGAKRTSTLISDLLAYTQALGADEESPVSANGETVLVNVLESLASSIEESGGHVSYDSLPIVPLREFHLEQVFQNLISNGLKYRKENEPPQVHVAVTRNGHFWEFSVRDNGIGIPEQYRNHVFGLFKRLHARDSKYPGTGIGLAICVKVIERYGGRIWFESKPNQGTTFYFTVPTASID